MSDQSRMLKILFLSYKIDTAWNWFIIKIHFHYITRTHVYALCKKIKILKPKSPLTSRHITTHMSVLWKHLQGLYLRSCPYGHPDKICKYSFLQHTLTEGTYSALCQVQHPQRVRGWGRKWTNRSRERIKKWRVDDHRRPLGGGGIWAEGGGHEDTWGRTDSAEGKAGAEMWAGTGCLSGNRGREGKRCWGD